MPTRSLLLSMIGVLTGLVLSLSASAQEGGVVGVWEQYVRNDAGPDPLIVLELRNDGTYAISGLPFVEDQGRYTLGGGTISFRSNAKPQFNRNMQFVIGDGQSLTLTIIQPFFYTETWQKRDDQPFNFRTVRLNGGDLPEALPLLMISALADVVRPWKDDALPTWIRVERMPSGGYQVVFHFFSPSAVQEMRITASEFGLSTSVHDGSRTIGTPLPMAVKDLPTVVSAAQAEGFRGALKKADLRMYQGFGPAWRTTFEGARIGATFSAETGERINEDVTGYIAQSNADWQEHAAIWRSVWEQHMPKAGSGLICYDGEPKCIVPDPYTCTDVGGTWDYILGLPESGTCRFL